jgi:FlaA1/EpsC-like NDP-sugar epimerase
MKNFAALLGREPTLFQADILAFNTEVSQVLNRASVAVLGAGGSIGKSVARQLAKYNLKHLSLIDISENALVECVRSIRGDPYAKSFELKSYLIDICKPEFMDFLRSQKRYDIIMNFAAVKHVRSQRDKYSLRQMISTNVIAPMNMLQEPNYFNSRIFVVSSDKAVNPANAMGATKALMELLHLGSGLNSFSSARFANVLMSDGSIFDSITRRVTYRQPFGIPSNISRYFITLEEAARISIIAACLADNRNILIPNRDALGPPISIKTMTERLLEQLGFTPYYLDRLESLDMKKPGLYKTVWPVICSPSETDGEKELEEFVANDDIAITGKFTDIDVIDRRPAIDSTLEMFRENLEFLREMITSSRVYDTSALLIKLADLVPGFNPTFNGNTLDDQI